MIENDSQSPDKEVKSKWRVPGDGLIAVSLLIGLMALYHANGDFLIGSDAIPNVYLPLNVLDQGRLTFTPENTPFMLAWALKTDEGRRVVKFIRWDTRPSDKSTVCFEPQGASLTGQSTFRQLHDSGKLSVLKEDYYVLPTADPDDGTYVNIYGVGAGLTALPFFAVQSLFVDDLAANRVALWYGAKFVASFCVAVSAAMVFLTCRRFTGRLPAFLIALAYGTGTCLWSVTAQTLWQSGPAIMFLSLGIYCLVRIEDNRWWAAGSAALLGWAVICRPTMALVAVAVGVYLAAVALRRWRAASDTGGLRKAVAPLLIYVLTGLPLAIGLAFYNWHYLGSPWTFGQVEAGRRFTETAAAAGTPWDTPVLRGFSGLLFSPSRGLLVYSPVLIFALWGLVRLWRNPRLSVLRPISIAAVLILLLPAKWFSWYGGQSFGYRLMVDALPLVALGSVAVIENIRRQKALVALFAVLLVWSVGVQIIGAYAYNTIGWNLRPGYAVTVPGNEKPFLVIDREVAEQYVRQKDARVMKVLMSIDLVPFHQRLWSVRDSQLVYYFGHFAESRRLKKQLIRQWLDSYVIRVPSKTKKRG